MDVIKIKRAILSGKIEKRLENRLLPSEFCAKWMRFYEGNTCPEPGDRGYKSAYLRTIARGAGIAFQTVNNWSSKGDATGIETLDKKCPKYVQVALTKQDLLNELKVLIDNHPVFTEYVDDNIE